MNWNEYAEKTLEWAEAQHEDDPSKTVEEWIDWLQKQLTTPAEPTGVLR